VTAKEGSPSGIATGVSGTVGKSALASTVDAKIAQVITFEEAQIGKPYQWGGIGPDAYDCSGLQMTAYAQVGVILPHYTLSQVAAIKYAVSTTDKSKWLPGDLIYPLDGDHVQMWIGNNTIIEAPHTGAFVQKVPCWSGPGTNYPLYAARRPLPGGSGAGVAGDAGSGPVSAQLDSSLLGKAKDVGHLFSVLSSAKFWLRVGMGAGGVGLIVFALLKLADTNMAGVSQAVSSALPEAALE
jgi:hypothetical protein